MNYPKREIIKGVISKIAEVLPSIPVYTVAPKDAVYPYIYLHEFFTEETGSKKQYIYEVEFLMEVIHKDLSSIDPILENVEDIFAIFKNYKDIEVEGYGVIEMNMVSGFDREELNESYKLNIEEIRIKITLQKN